MEKKYPVLKCNKELWNEIKPVLESFGIIDFNVVPNWNNNIYLISNYGYVDKNEIFIGNDKSSKINHKSSLRYLVDTKEEFLSAVAKLLGKEYPIKEQSSETKYPCIKCTQQLYDKIKDILINVGYKEVSIDVFDDEYLVINYQNKLGQLTNLCPENIKENNRYECSSIKGFLTKACELKGFEVVYNIFVKDNDAENHYFKYVINKENKTIEISETYNNEGECSANVTFKKQFKKKKERYATFYDPVTGESNTVVTAISAKGNDFDKDKDNDLNIDKPMEKINIANKLKHCKKGTKLYSPIFGEVEFDNIENNAIYVNTINNDNKIVSIPFESNGQFYSCYSNGECLLFPSKDNRDWNNFKVLEKGHLVMCADYTDTWQLRKYISDNIAGVTNSNFENESTSWKYIVPIEDFDFTTEDITINKEKSIV